MNIKQTMRYLEESKCDQKQGHEYQKIHNEMLSIAIEALEKQIPKLAQETQELIEIEYICPECDHINGQRFNYCWNCGQSITHS